MTLTEWNSINCFQLTQSPAFFMRSANHRLAAAISDSRLCTKSYSINDISSIYLARVRVSMLALPHCKYNIDKCFISKHIIYRILQDFNTAHLIHTLTYTAHLIHTLTYTAHLIHTLTYTDHLIHTLTFTVHLIHTLTYTAHLIHTLTYTAHLIHTLTYKQVLGCLSKPLNDPSHTCFMSLYEVYDNLLVYI